jgi:hypothetical protein
MARALPRVPGGDRGADEPYGLERQIRVAGVDGSVDHTDHDIGASGGACREGGQMGRVQDAGQGHVGLILLGCDLVSFPSQSTQISTSMVAPKSSQYLFVVQSGVQRQLFMQRFRHCCMHWGRFQEFLHARVHSWLHSNEQVA